MQRSLRTKYSAIRTCDFSTQSGRIESPPILLYIASNASRPPSLDCAAAIVRTPTPGTWPRTSKPAVVRCRASTEPYPDRITESIADWRLSEACSHVMSSRRSSCSPSSASEVKEAPVDQLDLVTEQALSASEARIVQGVHGNPRERPRIALRIENFL